MDTQAFNSDDYIGSYLQWLQTNVATRQLDSVTTEITVPFLDRHNDHIQIYVTASDEKVGIRLTDDGYTLSVLSAPVDKHRIRLMLNGHGVSVDEASQALYIEKHPQQFAQSMHALVQCVLAIRWLSK